MEGGDLEGISGQAVPSSAVLQRVQGRRRGPPVRNEWVKERGRHSNSFRKFLKVKGRSKSRKLRPREHDLTVRGQWARVLYGSERILSDYLDSYL